MSTAENNPESPIQLTLWAEGESGPLDTNGGDVYADPNGQVRQEWLAACAEERALTQDLMDQVADLSNLAAALRQVVQNGGSPGIDGMTTKELKRWFEENWRSLQESLLDGSYEPDGVRGVEIPKPGGGTRQLGIPTCRDRLVQQAISQVLTERYEKVFSERSYGFRPDRSAHQALQQAATDVDRGYRHVVDLDLKKFFDEVCHDRLMWLLGTRIGDKRLLALIGRFLRVGLMQGGLVSQRTKGTPQGSPLSPLLSNVVLDELDKILEVRGHRFVRYADDVIILVRSKAAAERVRRSITAYIEGRMRLKVNRQKSRICRPRELNFLGHSILSGGRLGLSQKSESRLKAKLRILTRRSRGISLERMIQEVNTALRGWLAYFRHARMKKRLKRLDGWIRRRIRCFCLKQCKRAIGIVRFFCRRGLPSRRAWRTALSGKGWYRLACTPASNQAMNRQWFESIGLFSLLDHYG